MTGNLLARGLLAGLLAGILAFAFAYAWGEPHIDAAIAIEEMAGDDHHHGDATAATDAETEAATEAVTEAEDGEPELVSRATQATLGLGVGMLIHGAALGGLFALVFATVQGRVGTTGVRTTAALLALAGFVAITLVPQMKYPANPPAVGSGDTIGLRTALFFAMLVLSILAMVIGTAVARRLRARMAPWPAAIQGGAVWLVLVAALLVFMPSVQEVPPDFPADVLWGFRVAMLGVHAILWTTIGLTFGALAERLLEGQPRTAWQH